MTQLVLPHTIDAGTDITAAEHQLNYTAIRDVINGGIEGGSGAAGNIKANGVTARELDDLTLLYAGANHGILQEGVIAAGDYKVTPGAGLVLNYAAGRALVYDDNGILATNALLPAVSVAGGTVTVAANASGNPRIDQIILTLTGMDAGTVSVLQGTASVGATIENRTGAAALLLGAIRLADILVPNGFAGPFVQNTHIRDRRQWARGFHKVMTGSNAGDQAIPGTSTWTYFNGSIVRAEIAPGNKIRARLTGTGYHTVAGNGGFVSCVTGAIGSVVPLHQSVRVASPAANELDVFSVQAEVNTPGPTALYGAGAWASVASLGIADSGTNGTWTVIFEEVMVQDAGNDGA